MNLFNTTMTAVDDDNVTTCEKKRVGWNAGLKGCYSDYTIALLKANHKGGRQVGYVYPESAKQKLKNRVYTNEHRANISATQKGRIQSVETRAKIAASAKARWAKQKEVK